MFCTNAQSEVVVKEVYNGVLDFYVDYGFASSIYDDWFWKIIFMLLVIGKNEDCVGSIGGIICGVQLIPLIGSILPTEIALKKNFDKNGTRR